MELIEPSVCDHLMNMKCVKTHALIINRHYGLFITNFSQAGK